MVKSFEEWEREANFYEFSHNGYLCRIIRINPGGHLCGYLEIPANHPLYKVEYEDLYKYNFNIHGGFTYSGGLTDYGIKSAQWWLGFDCAHGFDYSPHFQLGWQKEEDYKNVEYVRNQLISLIEQITKEFTND